MVNNYLKVVGKIINELKFSHELFGEKFYEFTVEIPRWSETMDTLSVIISDRLICNLDMAIGTYIVVEGQFRSYNSFEDKRNKLHLNVFAKDIKIPIDTELKNLLYQPNEIYLNGYICKDTIYRKTPSGREITDLLVAVNRSFGKSDYIPCIVWGRTARYCYNLKVGDYVKIRGRIQSREYRKQNETGGFDIKIAYEVSVSALEKINALNNRKEDSDIHDDCEAV